MSSWKEKVKSVISDENINAVKTGTKKAVWNTVKYGSIFGGGVLIGTVVGIVVFFHISNDPI